MPQANKAVEISRAENILTHFTNQIHVFRPRMRQCLLPPQMLVKRYLLLARANSQTAGLSNVVVAIFYFSNPLLDTLLDRLYLFGKHQGDHFVS